MSHTVTHCPKQSTLSQKGPNYTKNELSNILNFLYLTYEYLEIFIKIGAINSYRIRNRQTKKIKFRLFFFQIEYRNKLCYDYQNHVTIFTVGSKDENGVWCAVVVPETNFDGSIKLLCENLELTSLGSSSSQCTRSKYV